MYRVVALNGRGRQCASPWYKDINDAAQKVFSLGLEGIYLQVEIEQEKTDYENGYRSGYKSGYADGLVKSHVKTIKGVCKKCSWMVEHNGEYVCCVPRESASGLPWTRPLTLPNSWCSEFMEAEANDQEKV